MEQHLAARVREALAAEGEVDGPVADALGASRVREGPLNEGGLGVRAVRLEAVQLRELRRGEGPRAAHLVALRPPALDVVRHAPREGVAAEELVGAVADDRALVAELRRPAHRRGDDERVAQRHAVEGGQVLHARRQVRLQQVRRRHRHHVVLQMRSGGGGGGKLRVGRVRAREHRDCACEGHADLLRCSEDRTRVDAAREDNAALLWRGALGDRKERRVQRRPQLTRIDACHQRIRTLKREVVLRRGGKLEQHQGQQPADAHREQSHPQCGRLRRWHRRLLAPAQDDECERGERHGTKSVTAAEATAAGRCGAFGARIETTRTDWKPALKEQASGRGTSIMLK
eukprot:scaffold80902_cov69-Phaeocystis_antarctica.AAC.3